MTIAQPLERDIQRWSADATEILGGWASQLIWSGDDLWIGWASCEDIEPDLVEDHEKKWTLKPDVSLDQWIKTSRQIDFVISMGKVTPNGIEDTREISRTTSTSSGFSLISLPNTSSPGIVWEEYRDENSVILADYGDGATQIISNTIGAKLNLRSVCDDQGNLSTVWQQWNDVRSKDEYAPPQVIYSSQNIFQPNTQPTEITLNPDGQSSWSPSIADDGVGGLWCAWDGWDGFQYQIYARHAPSDSNWGPVKQISDSDRSDNVTPHLTNGYLHFGASVVANSDEAWITWSRSTEWGIINHRLNHMRTLHLRVMRSTESGNILVSIPPGKPVHGESGVLPVPTIPFLYAQEPEFINPQNPSIHFSESGDPVIFYRQFRRTLGVRDFGWSLCVAKHSAGQWTNPVRLTEYHGFPDSRYGIAKTKTEDSWVVATHSGESPTKKDAHNLVTNHKLVIEKLTLEPSRTADQLGVHEFLTGSLTAKERPPKEALHSDRRTRKIGSQQYDLLFGDLHRHTAYSKCMSAVDGDPLDQWRWAHDVADLDFYAITEHLEMQSYLEWRLVDDLTERLSNNGEVITLHGFELVLPPGHTNFFYINPNIQHALRVACLSARTRGLAEVWKNVRKYIPKEELLAIRHYHTFPGQTHEPDEVAATYNSDYESSIEIIQTRGDSSNWARDLWRKGFKMGVVGASDHSRNSAWPTAMTGLWLPSGVHDNKSVLEGLKAKRTFATNGVKMSVLLYATTGSASDSQFLVMGDEGEIQGKPKLIAEVAGTKDLQYIQFFRNDEIIHSEMIGTRESRIEIEDNNAPEGTHTYWIRVTQLPETTPFKNMPWGMAYSSPVWITIRL